MTAVKVKVAFQGGGAKLVALMAAAHALQDHEKSGKIEVVRAAGTSAGAIAACMFASYTTMPEWRLILGNKAEKHLLKIKKDISTVNFIIKSYFGIPLYNHVAYREFLKDLFEIRDSERKPIKLLHELRTPLTIYATNIQNGNIRGFTETNKEDDIENSIFCSSALPLIFHTFKKQRGPLVDGGVINNFPTSDLVGGNDQIETIGFSFLANKSYPYDNNFKSYITAIAFTAMDYAVSRSLSLLPKDNVLQIETTITTFNFHQALLELKSDKDYYFYYEQADRFINRFVDQKLEMKKIEEEKIAEAHRLKVEAEQSIEQKINEIKSEEKKFKDSLKLQLDGILKDKSVLENTIKDYHSIISQSSRLHISKKTIINYCYGLAKNKSGLNDYMLVREKIVPIDEKINGYGFICKDPDDFEKIEKILPRITRVENNSGRKYDATDDYKVTTIRLPKQSDLYRSDSSNVMFFFNPALQKIENTSYEISYSYEAGLLLRDIIEKNVAEYIYIARTIEVEAIDLVFFLPVSWDVELSGISEDRGNSILSSSNAPKVKKWVLGEILPKTELRSYDAPIGFKAVGWRAGSMLRGEAVGIAIRRPH